MITLFLLVAAVLGGMLYWKSVQRAEAEAEARESPAALFMHTLIYPPNREYLDALFREGHDEAFAKAYRSGSLFTPSEWDQQVYMAEIIEYVGRRAVADNRHDIAEALPATGQ